ncbi:MAG: Cytosine deaminase-like metal-dependent hydrolase [Thermoleophilia bacterium]|nr:Cytosine deaminase-like metal-dependent hydrolase [Thermoleophilia bacterium]
MSAELRWWAPWALPVSAPPARDVLVTMRDGRIAELAGGVAREHAAAMGDVALLDGCVIAPGFVNAHAHIEYAAYGELVDGLDFADWISDHIVRKRRLSPEQMRASAELGAAQALHSGITTIGDASFSGDAAHALHATGLRGRVYLEVFGGADQRGADDALAAVLARVDELPASDLLQYGISPHAPYTVGEPLYRAVAASGMPWMTHLLESAAEVAFLSLRGPLFDALRAKGFDAYDWSGRSPVQALADVLGPESVIVHHVHSDPADWEVLASTGAGVAHCPRSNARLGCGVMDLGAADRVGAIVGLGTDSPASAGPLDMFAELRSAVELHRAVSRDARWPPLARLLRAATLDAAQVLGFDDLGTIDVGSHADLVAVHVGTVDDPLAAYVLGGSADAVAAVAIAGVDKGVRRGNRDALSRAHERASAARTLLALPVKHSVRR